jgi:rubredoxin
MYFANGAAFWMHLQVAWDMHAAVHEFASVNPRRQRLTGDPLGGRTASVLTQRRGNAMTTFERFGDAGQIEPGMRMECELCGYCYDPAEGDVDGQIPEGTTFEALPPHWTCPNCSASKSNFVVVHEQ